MLTFVLSLWKGTDISYQWLSVWPGVRLDKHWPSVHIASQLKFQSALTGFKLVTIANSKFSMESIFMIYICTKLDPIIVKERCGLVGPRRCISWAWLELSWAMEVAAKVKERLTFYTFTGTHVNVKKNEKETSSHCINIE